MLPDGIYAARAIMILVAHDHARWVRGRMPPTARNMPALPTAF